MNVRADASGQSFLRQTITLAGVFAPAIISLLLTTRADGVDAAWAMVRQIARWHVPARWYLFAIGYMAVVKIAVAGLFRMIIGVWPPFGDTPWWIMLAAMLTSTWAQAGEEIGWRAYALPRLAERTGLALASIILGVIWAVWHLPLFFILGGDTVGQSFPLYLLQLTALSVAIAWLYWRTSGSLLLVMLMHAAINNTKDIVPSAGPGGANPFTLSGTVPAGMTLLILWIPAAYLLARMRGVNTATE